MESKVDIASSLHESAVQPLNYSFPSIVIGTKGLCFSAKWYEQYEWIEYSIAKDAVFCYPCCFFANAMNRAEDRFGNLGFREWKHVGGESYAFAKHNCCNIHQMAVMNWSQFKQSVATGTSIANK
uniref:TTF-type domain-containing protein n=1 Tax=Amphimedon queenslandica TaxID=400682 RepID=A0A1X7UR36_AMPQE